MSGDHNTLIEANIPSVLRPRYRDDLIRLGARKDGGYVLTRTGLSASDFLLSCGISYEYSFDRAFVDAISPERATTLLPIIRERVRPHSIVYTDSHAGYGALDVSGFTHRRINHSERFGDGRNHINGIENFWNQAKRHLRRFNGIAPAHFPLFLKECEWRFNTATDARN